MTQAGSVQYLAVRRSCPGPSEGTDPSGHKGKGLRMESLGKGGVGLDLQHLLL